MSYTWENVTNEAREMLKDNSGNFNWEDSLLLFLACDAVEIIYKIVRKIAPNLYEQSYDIPILEDNAGPYNLPDDFHSVINIFDSNGQKLTKTYREAVKAVSKSGEPREYYLSGRAPVKIYFDSTPDKAYTHELWYNQTFTRASLDVNGAIPATAVPLDDETRSAVREWILKFAGIVEEYKTLDEEKKIALMMPLIEGDTVKQANPLQFGVSGVGF